MDALGLHLGQELAESAKGLRVGMADGDGLTLLLCFAKGELQLLANGRDFLHIIQKRNITVSAANASVLGGVIGDRGGGGAAIDEKQIPISQNVHEIGHQRAVGGGEGTLMVVDADDIGDVLQHGAHDVGNLGRGHTGAELLRFGQLVAKRLHG